MAKSQAKPAATKPTPAKKSAAAKPAAKKSTAATKPAAKKPTKKPTPKTKKNLVILESPSKAKTIRKILGSSYKIESCVGHIRDLPKSLFGIDIEADYEPKYQVIRGKGDIVKTLRAEAKAAKKVYLATDPDREGEAISWHLTHALKLPPEKTARITFNEITKAAVTNSIKNARDINMDLVDAQQARRVLDRMVGYSISPLLWKKVRKGLSAGRVQSVVLKLICEREEQIVQFVPKEYWTLEATFATKKPAKSPTFVARYLASDNNERELATEADATEIADIIRKSEFTITEIKQGRRKKNPPAPFTTSTLQQEASKLFGYSAQKTLQVAQRLYEGIDIAGEGSVGLVTYIRTDSTRISDDAYQDATTHITDTFGKEYVPQTRPTYKSRARAQDAHEAIRPTAAMRTPASIKQSLAADEFKIYKLIWERLLASQMTPAEYDTIAIKLAGGGVTLRATGSVLRFDGYLRVYGKNEDAERDFKFPEVTQGAQVFLREIHPAQHFTQPPPRYNEGSLVKTMEEMGIGRPSTFAQTIATLLFRAYITKEARTLYPTQLGELVCDIMEDYFSFVVDTGFTAQMEDNLDLVESGQLAWKSLIRDFYPPLVEKVNEAEEKIGDMRIEPEVSDVPCEKCGTLMVVKFSRHGKFLACPRFPECRSTKPILDFTDTTCPLCKKRVAKKKSKKNRDYYGCEDNPTCEFISWDLPAGLDCPECGKFCVTKGRKTPFIACSECKYRKSIE